MIMLSGYFGFDNWGDEAILESLCQQWESIGVPRTELVVLAGNPTAVRQQFGTQAMPRTDFIGILRSLRQKPIFVSGGGSLLQDTTSWRSVPYYLGLTELAFRFGCPVVMYAQGIGPIHRRWLQRWSVRAFSQAAASSVRDFESLRTLKEWGLKSRLPKLTTDPVYGLRRSLANSSLAQPLNKRLLLNLRPFPDHRRHSDSWFQLLEQWGKDGWEVDFLPLGPGDSEVGDWLQKQVPKLGKVQPTTLNDVLSCIESYSVFISMRLHGVIFSAISGTLPIGVAYDPKVSAAAAQLGVPVVSPDHLSELPGLLATVPQNYCELQQQMGMQVQQLRIRNRDNEKILQAAYRRWLGMQPQRKSM